MLTFQLLIIITKSDSHVWHCLFRWLTIHSTQPSQAIDGIQIRTVHSWRSQNSHVTARHSQEKKRSTEVPASAQRKRCVISPWTTHRKIHTSGGSAKKLKSAWIQTHKIKSKWNAEKRREGVQTGTSPTAPALETAVSNVTGIMAGQAPDHRPQPIDIDTGSDVSPSKPDEQRVEASSSRTIREPVRTAKTGPAMRSSQQKDRRPGRPSGYQRKKASMRTRMNALLEKIQKEVD